MLNGSLGVKAHAKWLPWHANHMRNGSLGVQITCEMAASCKSCCYEACPEHRHMVAPIEASHCGEKQGTPAVPPQSAFIAADPEQLELAYLPKARLPGNVTPIKSLWRTP